MFTLPWAAGSSVASEALDDCGRMCRCDWPSHSFMINGCADVTDLASRASAERAAFLEIVPNGTRPVALRPHLGDSSVFRQLAATTYHTSITTIALEVSSASPASLFAIFSKEVRKDPSQMRRSNAP